jgi:hypothetical protein
VHVAGEFVDAFDPGGSFSYFDTALDNSSLAMGYRSSRFLLRALLGAYSLRVGRALRSWWNRDANAASGGRNCVALSLMFASAVRADVDPYTFGSDEIARILGVYYAIDAMDSRSISIAAKVDDVRYSFLLGD